MKIGFFGINVGACADPVVLARVARTAEAADPIPFPIREHT